MQDRIKIPVLKGESLMSHKIREAQINECYKKALYSLEPKKILLTTVWKAPEDFKPGQFIKLGEPLATLVNGSPVRHSGPVYIETTEMDLEEFNHRFAN